MLICTIIVKEIFEQMNKVINFINLTYSSACIPGKVAKKYLERRVQKPVRLHSKSLTDLVSSYSESSLCQVSETPMSTWFTVYSLDEGSIINDKHTSVMKKPYVIYWIFKD